MQRLAIYLLLISLSPIQINAQSNNNKEEYYSGYKTLHALDKTRLYKPVKDSSHALFFRPIDMDIWYPATKPSSDAVMIFKDFLNLFVTRPNYYRDTITSAAAINGMAKSFCEMNKCSDSTKLLYYKTSSYKNAKPAKGKFPLIIYLASYGSNCFENYTLFEELSKQGFVIISVNSIGRFPGDMTMKYDDVMEQVNDAVFSFNHLSKFSNIDFTKVGIVGYSWGGVAGTILAGKIPASACMVSLDGSEFHHYGFNKNEDADFDGIVRSKAFKNLSIPYLRLEQNPPSANNSKNDSVYNFFEKLSQNNLVLKVNNAEHYHFCCLPSVVNASGNCKDNGPYTTITKLTISYLNNHLKASNTFVESLAQELDKTVRKKL
jgi:hypothetical protein